jgi:pSer/pThr/pTyr-binding forkhead associated (FHA) protein
MQINLSWENPTTGEQRSPVLHTPIAFGREFSQLPSDIDGLRTSRIQLDDGQISRFHALIKEEQGQLVVTDQNSSNGISVNGDRCQRQVIGAGDRLQIGSYIVTILQVGPPTNSSKILFNPITNIPDPHLTTPPQSLTQNGFLPAIFQNSTLTLAEVQQTGLAVDTYDYAAIGGGFGSFCWVDLLRIAGVKREQIAVLGPEKSVYGRYHQLCLNAHGPGAERLRSTSDACPDNIWGFPSYGWREASHQLLRGKMAAALKTCWQLLAEPMLDNVYGPTDGQVKAAVDREARRIGWSNMLRYALVEAIRKTDDGRYAILYNQGDRYAIVLATYIHLAPGYPAVAFLPDLQEYRQQTKDFTRVVNAYEDHDGIYEHLAQRGGTIVLRGAGIVACRVLQRIYQVRRAHPERDITVLHLWPQARSQGQAYGLTQRSVQHNYELQVWEWPKACWGGSYKMLLEASTPEEQARLLQVWEATTIPQRRDWLRVLGGGLGKGWYQMVAGKVQSVTPNLQGRGLTIYLQNVATPLSADYVIDATGIPGTVMDSNLLADLVQQYQLPLNDRGYLQVTPEFALAPLHNDRGRIYSAGAITAGGSYGPVDSFLGLQYAALCAVGNLTDDQAPGLQELNPWRSAYQWLRWLFQRPPG